ncbi:MAG: DUF2268 domain-containing protein [Clostridiales bacterium]|nr:DUF2268 domain-containing protein [Clostridiales bacterium]
MKQITINTFRSDVIYQKILEAPIEKKEDIFRYELMKPFQEKWDIYRIPLKAKQPRGYDIVMASDMLGYLTPKKVDDTVREQIKLLSDDGFWEKCQRSIELSFQQFLEYGIELPRKDYVFTNILLNPESPYAIMCDNYCGDGGIPGYITGALVPSKETLARVPIALAHEVNHNVRFQFELWRDDITVGEYMICEGLAENFATSLYGEDQVGPWVSKTDQETLNDYIKPIIFDGLDKSGMAEITGYMYGDEMAKMRDYFPVGLPYCAGYACGYYLIKHYLHKTGKSIVEATLTPAAEILREVKDFWK